MLLLNFEEFKCVYDVAFYLYNVKSFIPLILTSLLQERVDEDFRILNIFIGNIRDVNQLSNNVLDVSLV